MPVWSRTGRAGANVAHRAHLPLCRPLSFHLSILGVLAQGAAPEGSLEREDYDKLRAGLAGGNLAARLYAIVDADFRVAENVFRL
jgi:hypothetical protein